MGREGGLEGWRDEKWIVGIGGGVGDCEGLLGERAGVPSRGIAVRKKKNEQKRFLGESILMRLR